MWNVMIDQLKQDRTENEKAIAQLLAQMEPITSAIAKLEAEIKRIDDLTAWAQAQRRDSAHLGLQEGKT